MRQQRIDELNRRDHYYLDAQDQCYFFLEYSARQGRVFGATNELVRDLLRPEGQPGFGPDVRKQRAIRRLAQVFKAALNGGLLRAATFVPLPSARPRNDPAHDDRMRRVLRSIAEGLDIRDLIELAATRESGDFSGIRAGADVLYASMRVVPALLWNRRRR